jgi:hypothetical protein
MLMAQQLPSCIFLQQLKPAVSVVTPSFMHIRRQDARFKRYAIEEFEDDPLQYLASPLLDLPSAFDGRTTTTAANFLIAFILDLDSCVDGQLENFGDSSLLLR